MKVKVKVRKYDSQPLIPSLLATFIFGTLGAISLVLVINFLLNFDVDYFVAIMSEDGMAITMFFAFGMLGLFLVYSLFRFPRNYTGKLKEKENIFYNDKNIWNMKFEIKGKDNNDLVLCCYTETENDFEVGRDYTLEIKEFNWRIRSISDFDESRENKLVQGPTMVPVFMLFFFVLGSGISFLIFKIFYDIERGNDYLANIFSIVICSFLLMTVFSLYRAYCSDNDDSTNSIDIIKEENAIERNLRRYSKLKESCVKVPSTFVRLLPLVLLKYLISFLIVLFLVNIIGVIESDRNLIEMVIVNYEFNLVLLTIFTVFLGLNLLTLIPYINYDKKLIEKYNLVVGDNRCEVKDLKSFYIFRPAVNNVLEKYYVTDSKNNLIYIIDIDGVFEKKYVISDNFGNKVGEVIKKSFSLTDAYIIRLVNEEPFYVRKKVMTTYDYEVAGKAYRIKGDNNGVSNLICDSHDNEIALIMAIEKSDGRYVLGDTLVELKEDVINSEDIIFMSFCVTLGNFHSKK